MAMMFLRHPCEHGKYFGCLKCGHRHSENPKKICHKDHTEEHKKWAKECDVEFKDIIKNWGKKK